MDILLIIVIIVVVIFILAAIFSPSAEELEQKIIDADKEYKKKEEEFLNITKEALVKQDHTVEGADTLDLCLDGMIMLSIQKFGDIIDVLKNNTHPYLKLIACHMFIEQLSDNFSVSDNNSSFEFADNFLRSKLTEDDIEFNMLDYVDEESGESYLVTALTGLQDRLHRVMRGEELNSSDRLNLTIEFCTDIVSLIDDDDLKDDFITKSSESLKEKNLFNSDSESAYLSIGV